MSTSDQSEKSDEVSACLQRSGVRLPIAWRIAVTTLIGLTGMLVVLLTIVVGARDLRAARDESLAALQARNLADRGRGSLAEARERALTFVTAPNAEGISAVTTLVQRCESDFQEIRSMGRFGELDQKITSLIAGLSSYKLNFEQVAGIRERIGFSENDHERAALSRSERFARREIDRASYDPSPEVAKGRMPIRLLQIESASKDFLLSKNIKSMIDFRNQMADLVAFIQEAPIMEPARSQLTTAVGGYNDTFKQLAQSEDDLSKALGQLNEAAAAIAPIYLDLVAAFTAQAEQANLRFEQHSNTIALWTLLVIAITATVCTILSAAVGRAIGKPIEKMTDLMRKLAAGDIHITLESIVGRRDEIGDMARALDVFRQNAVERADLAREIQEQRERQEKERRQQMLEIAQQLEASVASVVEGVSVAAGSITSTADKLNALAASGHSRCKAVATAAEQGSSNVQAVAAAAEELSASIAKVGSLVEASMSVTQRMVVGSEQANTRIGGLSDAALRVGEVVELVRGIATQTHLLALNATIEAARAGQVGKGFSVVAQEVKALADQTSEATEGIGSLIKGMRDATHDATAVIGAVNDTITEVRELASAIAFAVEQQTAATLEIARILNEAAVATRAVATDIGEVEKLTDRTGHVAEELVSAAGGMSGESKNLRFEVNNFLDKVKAA